jgi:energy-coupling factor transport system substrate-specific component
VQEQGPYDELVGRLQQLRADAGLPSYGDIATNVSRVRVDRGLTPERARVGRTTVYDAFRMGRQRIDADLVGDIARALGADDRAAEEWATEARNARQPTFEVADPALDPPSTEVDAPDADAVLDPRPRGPRVVVGVLLAALAVNLAGRGLVAVLDLPVYLDIIGTAFSAIVLGPWWGALVGLATNVAGMTNGGTDSLIFAPVNVLGALVWGYGVRHGWGRSIGRFFTLNLVVAIVSACIAIPVIVLVGDGTGGHGADRITASTMDLVASVWASVTVSSLLTEAVDKLLCGFVSLAVIESLPARLLPPGWGIGRPAA